MPKLALLLAIPLLAGTAGRAAAADTWYRYETESGSIAFTDDPERVPERYRQDARMFEAKSVFDYERTSISEPQTQTPPAIPHPGTATLTGEQLRQLRLPSITVEAAPGVFIDVPVAQDGTDEPINVEGGWVQRDGTLYPYTVIKRGDEVLLETYEHDWPQP